MNWTSYIDKMPRVGKKVIGYSPVHDDIFLVAYNGYRQGWRLLIEDEDILPSERIRISKWYYKPNTEGLDFHEYRKNLRKYRTLSYVARQEILYALAQLIDYILFHRRTGLNKELLVEQYDKTIGRTRYPEIADCALRAVRLGWAWE